MKKLSIKDIVDFRSKSDRGKQNYASTIKLDKEKAITKGGGDYWVTTIPGIRGMVLTEYPSAKR